MAPPLFCFLFRFCYTRLPGLRLPQTCILRNELGNENAAPPDEVGEEGPARAHSEIPSPAASSKRLHLSPRGEVRKRIVLADVVEVIDEVLAVRTRVDEAWDANAEAVGHVLEEVRIQVVFLAPVTSRSAPTGSTGKALQPMSPQSPVSMPR
eukprot:CAMPEP_0180549916 /NCGR_PEP_ID=MMETSP1036_2-20121128/72366_1 /TAXON_ID=632150 /ORGANISM="Azadinium spinosum, Strain 3D9" /LENGTH=151 /DNA_ID=CAMNT_0022565133 /DNA_START=114 /DNA_END=565 /DNA_ORIENTATION=-